MPLHGHADHPGCNESHIWAVVLEDGTVHMEYPEPGVHNRFADMATRPDVRELHILPNPWLGLTGQDYIITIDHAAGVRPIMFRTNAINQQTGEHRRWHVFGWQITTPGGDNVQSLTYLPDGETGPVVFSHERLMV